MLKKHLWVWLSQIFGSNASAFSDKLMHSFANDPEAVYNATESELHEAIPNSERTVQTILRRDLNQAGAILSLCEKNNIGVLTPDSPLYPSGLRSITGRPLALYYKGTIPDFAEYLTVGVVGTRRVSDYGANAAYTIAYDLAKSGAIVVSGMAEGTDGIAHRGALDALGFTVAILGSGIDVVYPKKNAKLYSELILNGLIMTEYAPGTPPNGWRFPQRNRLISGISSAVLVVEAAEKSGSLITADYAKKQGRLLYSIPGKVGEYTSLGTNELIRSGAKMTTCANDIITDFLPLYPHTLIPSNKAHLPKKQDNLVAQARPTVPPTPPAPPSELEYVDDPKGASYLSLEVDPRLEAARKALEERINQVKKLMLDSPEENVNEEGYTIPAFWKKEPRAQRLPKLSPPPPPDVQPAEDDEYIPEKRTKEPRTPKGAPRLEIPEGDRSSSSKSKESPKISERKKTLSTESLSEDERKIVEVLSRIERASTDDFHSAELPIHILLSTLTVREIR